MTTTDSKGIVFLEESDIISPFHTLINGLQTGTSNAVGDIQTDVAALETTVTEIAGTDPVDVPYKDSSWVVQTGAARPKYFKRDGIASLTSGRIIKASGSTSFSANAETPFLNIPVGFRPPTGYVATAMCSVYVGSDAYLIVRISIKDNGDVCLRPATTFTLSTSAAYIIEVPSMFWIPA